MAKRSKPKRKAPSAAVPAKSVAAEIPPATEPNGKTILLRVAVIAAMVLWIYLPVIHGQWLWDDKELISQNDLIRDPAGWWKIWVQPGDLIDFYPLWSTVEWLQWHLWGNDTAGYHVVNIALHFASALLVWRLLARLGLRFAWLGGLFFAIHPVQVESVAWMVELKNTLSLPPFLLAMIAWIDYDAHHRRRDYFLALGLFLVAMLCKTTMAMFPFVILLYAWWRRCRIQAIDFRASAPFFSVSLVLGLATLWFQEYHAIRGAEIPMGGIGARLALSGSSLAFYVTQCVWPAGLLPVYPKWSIDPPLPLQVAPWFVLFGVLALCWVKRATWGRHALLGLGFFALNLAPFLGFSKTFYMTFSWVVDHNLYLPIIGLVGLGVAGLERLDRLLVPACRGVIAVLVALIATALLVESHGYAKMFVDQETLWTYTLERNPDAWPGLNNLGVRLLNAGHPREAMAHFQAALRQYPTDAMTHNNLGNAFLALNRNAEAMDQYRIAIAISPQHLFAHINLGIALVKTGNDAGAETEFKTALLIDPRSAPAHQNLGALYLRTGRPDDAAREYGAILHDDSHYAEYQKNLEKQRAASKSPGGN
jgi:protein O-mannosyl-transferase